MGQLKHDGQATQGGFTAPGSEVVNFGDLYHLNGWNHIALASIGANDTVRSYGGEISDRIWYVKVPDAVDPDVGDFLYWSDTEEWKVGETDLQTTANGSPCAIVEEDKGSGDYCAVRVLNIGPLDAGA